MQIIFTDESTIEIDRAHKTYDFKDHSTRLSLDFSAGVDFEDLLEKDFSSFTIHRNGMTDVTFTGYSVSDYTESYDYNRTDSSLTLIK